MKNCIGNGGFKVHHQPLSINIINNNVLVRRRKTLTMIKDQDHIKVERSKMAWFELLTIETALDTNTWQFDKGKRKSASMI